MTLLFAERELNLGLPVHRRALIKIPIYIQNNHHCDPKGFSDLLPLKSRGSNSNASLCHYYTTDYQLFAFTTAVKNSLASQFLLNNSSVLCFRMLIGKKLHMRLVQCGCNHLEMCFSLAICGFREIDGCSTENNNAAKP